jgi:lambda repressor-like predicted transcriptional regulator
MWKAAGRVPLRHVPAVASALGVPNETIWPALGAHQVAA